jgi:3-methyl-2-oxobutanoate hydroxymethyltransferase
MARLTVKDLLDQRGKLQFAMLRVETLDEAEAAARAEAATLSTKTGQPVVLASILG